MLSYITASSCGGLSNPTTPARKAIRTPRARANTVVARNRMLRLPDRLGNGSSAVPMPDDIVTGFMKTSSSRRMRSPSAPGRRLHRSPRVLITGGGGLLASTSEVYGDPLEHPQKESYWGNVNPVGPRGVYDEAKRFAEALTIAYQSTHSVDTKIARIFNTYGPRMRLDDGRAIPAFMTQ